MKSIFACVIIAFVNVQCILSYKLKIKSSWWCSRSHLDLNYLNRQIHLLVCCKVIWLNLSIGWTWDLLVGKKVHSSIIVISIISLYKEEAISKMDVIKWKPFDHLVFCRRVKPVWKNGFYNLKSIAENWFVECGSLIAACVSSCLYNPNEKAGQTWSKPEERRKWLMLDYDHLCHEWAWWKGLLGKKEGNAEEEIGSGIQGKGERWVFKRNE